MRKRDEKRSTKKAVKNLPNAPNNDTLCREHSVQTVHATLTVIKKKREQKFDNRKINKSTTEPKENNLIIEKSISRKSAYIFLRANQLRS